MLKAMRNLCFACILLLSVRPALAQMDAERYSPVEQANMDTINTMFDAFLTGDMDTLFGMLASDIVWEVNGSSDLNPLHGSRSGTDAVMEWFGQLDSLVETLDFGVDSMWADGDVVFVLCHNSGRLRENGNVVNQREMMVFWLADGRVTRLLDFDDSLQEYMAMTGGGDDEDADDEDEDMEDDD